MKPTDKLTAHFSVWEFFVTEQASYNPDSRGFSQKLFDERESFVDANILALANQLEVLRALLGGKGIKISSGYRSKTLNKLVGGVENSWHRKGLAVDVNHAELSPRVLQARVKHWWGGELLGYQSFTHIGAIGTK